MLVLGDYQAKPLSGVSQEKRCEALPSRYGYQLTKSNLALKIS